MRYVYLLKMTPSCACMICFCRNLKNLLIKCDFFTLNIIFYVSKLSFLNNQLLFYCTSFFNRHCEGVKRPKQSRFWLLFVIARPCLCLIWPRQSPFLFWPLHFCHCEGEKRPWQSPLISFSLPLFCHCKRINQNYSIMSLRGSEATVVISVLLLLSLSVN